MNYTKKKTTLLGDFTQKLTLGLFLFLCWIVCAHAISAILTLIITSFSEWLASVNLSSQSIMIIGLTTFITIVKQFLITFLLVVTILYNCSIVVFLFWGDKVGAFLNNSADTKLGVGEFTGLNFTLITALILLVFDYYLEYLHYHFDFNSKGSSGDSEEQSTKVEYLSHISLIDKCKVMLPVAFLDCAIIVLYSLQYFLH